jgi:hypothetical protein
LDRNSSHGFLYATGEHSARDSQPFQMRDLGALADLQSVLFERGYRPGANFLNYPYVGIPPAKLEELVQVDVSELGPGSILIQPTRPPMHDRINPTMREYRKEILRSYTILELRLFRVFSEHFHECSRVAIRLGPRTADISSAMTDHSVIDLYQHGSAGYKTILNVRTRESRSFEGVQRRPSPAFLIYREEAWPDGPGLLARSAEEVGRPPSGTTSSRSANRELIGKYAFVMAELTPPRSRNASRSRRPTMTSSEWRSSARRRSAPTSPGDRLPDDSLVAPAVRKMG